MGTSVGDVLLVQLLHAVIVVAVVCGLVNGAWRRGRPRFEARMARRARRRWARRQRRAGIPAQFRTRYRDLSSIDTTWSHRA